MIFLVTSSSTKATDINKKNRAFVSVSDSVSQGQVSCGNDVVSTKNKTVRRQCEEEENSEVMKNGELHLLHYAREGEETAFWSCN